MFNNMLRDKVTLIKGTGEKYENIKADVQPNMIFINDGTLPIEEGDRLIRVLPSKLEESYVVVDRGFYSAIGGFKDHYQIKVKKESNVGRKNSTSTINNFYGDISNSQIQQNVENSSQTLTINEDYKQKDELIIYLKQLTENIHNLDLKEDQVEIISANIEALKNELKISNKKEVITQGLLTIRNVLEGVAGSLIASGLIYQMNALIK